jgi:hypothetical protein
MVRAGELLKHPKKRRLLKKRKNKPYAAGELRLVFELIEKRLK